MFIRFIPSRIIYFFIPHRLLPLSTLATTIPCLNIASSSQRKTFIGFQQIIRRNNRLIWIISKYLHKKHKLIITLVAICDSCMLVVNPKSIALSQPSTGLPWRRPPQRIFPPFISAYVFVLASRGVSIQISVTFSQLRCFLLYRLFFLLSHPRGLYCIPFLNFYILLWYLYSSSYLFSLASQQSLPPLFIFQPSSDSLQSPFNKCKYPSTGNERRRRRRQQRRQGYGWIDLEEHQKSCHTKITISFYIPHSSKLAFGPRGFRTVHKETTTYPSTLSQSTLQLISHASLPRITVKTRRIPFFERRLVRLVSRLKLNHPRREDSTNGGWESDTDCEWKCCCCEAAEGEALSHPFRSLLVMRCGPFGGRKLYGESMRVCSLLHSNEHKTIGLMLSCISCSVVVWEGVSRIWRDDGMMSI